MKINSISSYSRTTKTTIMAEVKMDLQELKALEDKVVIANNTIKKKEEEVLSD